MHISARLAFLRDWLWSQLTGPCAEIDRAYQREYDSFGWSRRIVRASRRLARGAGQVSGSVDRSLLLPSCRSPLRYALTMQMDKASKALAQGLPTSVPRSYRALADHSNVPRSTLHDCARGQRSIEAKAQSQQYLTPFEEKAMINFILQMSALGAPVRVKYIPSIAFTVARGRPEHNRPSKPPGKN